MDTNSFPADLHVRSNRAMLLDVLDVLEKGLRQTLLVSWTSRTLTSSTPFSSAAASPETPASQIAQAVLTNPRIKLFGQQNRLLRSDASIDSWDATLLTTVMLSPVFAFLPPDHCVSGR
jgi:hypothetical protein